MHTAHTVLNLSDLVSRNCKRSFISMSLTDAEKSTTMVECRAMSFHLKVCTMVSSEETEGPVKSRPSRELSYVKFVNRTRKPVDIIWKGFNGENIRYVSRLGHTRHFSVNTFVSHPWQAWNSDTFRLMNLGGGLVFYPTKWNERDGRALVYIDEPVRSLLRLCLEKVKSLVNAEDLDKLEIPSILVEELKKRRTVEVQAFGGQR